MGWESIICLLDWKIFKSLAINNMKWTAQRWTEWKCYITGLVLSEYTFWEHFVKFSMFVLFDINVIANTVLKGFLKNTSIYKLWFTECLELAPNLYANVVIPRGWNLETRSLEMIRFPLDHEDGDRRWHSCPNERRKRWGHTNSFLSHALYLSLPQDEQQGCHQTRRKSVVLDFPGPRIVKNEFL